MTNTATTIAIFSSRIFKTATVAAVSTVALLQFCAQAAMAEQSESLVESPVVQQVGQRAAYIEREVEVGTVAPLRGILTLPATQTQAKLPCVVLIHGVGRNDRDNSIGPNRPFLEIARNLASTGVAVLRYDKRTFMYPLCTMDPNFGVEQETVDDALSAIEVVKQQPEIDADQIFIAGHSMGGLLVSQVAERAKNISGVILLCSPGRKLEEIAQIPSPLFLLKSWLQVKQLEAPAQLSRLGKRTFIALGTSDLIVPPNDGTVPWKSAADQDHNLTLNVYNGMNHFLLQLPNDAASNVIPGHVPDQLVHDISAWLKSTVNDQLSQGQEAQKQI